MPLTDSLAHHFLDYIHFCVRCAPCMRKFEPTKTFKTPWKSFKTTTKTIKRLQKPSNAYKSQKLSHVVFLSPKGQVSLYKVLCHVYSPNRKNIGQKSLGRHVSIKWLVWHIMAILWREPTVYKMHCRILPHILSRFLVGNQPGINMYKLESQRCIKSSSRSKGMFLAQNTVLSPIVGIL